ncbi:MAG: YraN family protein [Sulfuricaulis sp.]|nr:YraN family protein [Sulfuricaulis sp.]
MTQNPRTNLSRGRDAEELACRHLEQQGMSLAERNYRSRFGEIDLIMQDRDTLVFVEVRYRARGDFGSAAETVDARKQGRLRATAEYYLQNTPRASKKACRFDIVAITGDGEDTDFRWLRNVF